MSHLYNVNLFGRSHFSCLWVSSAAVIQGFMFLCFLDLNKCDEKRSMSFCWLKKEVDKLFIRSENQLISWNWIGWFASCCLKCRPLRKCGRSK